MRVELSMAEKLKRIFDLKRVSFDEPGDVPEQECMFVEIESCRTNIKDGQETGRATGRIRVFGNQEKLPLTFFPKQLMKAKPVDAKKFFFFDFEEMNGRFQNIVERSFGFIYFFDSQYDPDIGTITSMETEFQTEEA